MKIDLDVIIEDNAWEEVVSNQRITEIAKITLQHLGYFNKATVGIAIMLTSNDHMQRLNKEFRSSDKPTNVLSFPDNDLTEQDLLELKDKKTYIYIGDIALGHQIVKDESDDFGVEFIDHFTHLIVHGILHLLGFDHETEDEYITMKNFEIEILKKMNISSPYND